jgi:hypothetical protein
VENLKRGVLTTRSHALRGNAYRKILKPYSIEDFIFGCIISRYAFTRGPREPFHRDKRSRSRPSKSQTFQTSQTSLAFALTRKDCHPRKGDPFFKDRPQPGTRRLFF